MNIAKKKRALRIKPKSMLFALKIIFIYLFLLDPSVVKPGRHVYPFTFQLPLQ